MPGYVVEVAMVNGEVHGATRAEGKMRAFFFFFEDEIPGGKRHDKKWPALFAFFFLGRGELRGSDMIVENQTQTTELDSNYWQGVSGN